MYRSPKVGGYYCRKCKMTVNALKAESSKPRCPSCGDEGLLNVARRPERLEPVPCRCGKAREDKGENDA